MVVITTPLVTHSGVTDVYIAENQYAIVATTSGIDIVDLLTQKVISSGTLSPAPLSITADPVTASGKIYVGTSGAGIYTTSYQGAIIPFSDFTGSLVQRFTTTSTPPISGDVVKDLDGLPKWLLIATSGGVDFLYNENLSATRVLPGFGSSACHLTSTGGGYWLDDGGGVEVNYDLQTSTGTGIITVDFEYRSLGVSDPELPSEPASDIAISETAPSTTLAFSTASGVLVVEENPGNEAASSSKIPDTEDFISVDFSEGADFDSGLLYVATINKLEVFGLETGAVSGTHSSSVGTRGQNLLDEDVIVVRTTNIT